MDDQALGRGRVARGAFAHRYERLLRTLVLDGIGTGEFRPVDPHVAVFAILGAINWIARWWYRPEGRLSTVELGDGFADYLLGGVLRR